MERLGGTQRGLKSRHIQLIALGGCIGTGLFVGSGSVLSTVGPGSLFLSYIFMSTIIWVVMNVLGEMTTYLPVKGASVPYYINRFAEPSLAFAAGWNYWYAYAMLVASEVTAAGLIIEYWTTNINIAVWITIILFVCLVLNIFAVSFYGEAEFWFSSLKLIAIVGLIILGVVLFFGGGPNHDRLGFRYWQHPGAFNEFMTVGGTGRFLGFWYAFARSGFSFILSPELITIAAGESIAPRRNIPKATKRFVYRLIAFYVLGSLVIGVIVASDDPLLLAATSSGASDASASPYVLGAQRAGIKVLNHIINAVILTSAWSAGNSFLYAGSRSLYSLSVTGQAPKIFAKCNKQGVPYVAVLATFAIACLAYLNVSSGAAAVFTWFSNIATISGFIAWIVVLITYLRFRKAMIFNNALHTLPFRTALQPYATWYALLIVALVTLTNGFYVFFPGKFSASSFLAAYITIPIFLVLYLGHKAIYRTPWAIEVSEVDVFSGKEECDMLEATDIIPVPKNILERVWFWIA
ncbi:amino acid permease/ SLC12A domain-containing protein [Collybia nuda]|uniref:Amino acid permease/ SLC12A domain-containing protein n=1 Tax=Collybia nuda TaxID=64659 RepID=A0A9P5Y6L0_9AGAR|nr:amino acid permease/ SLC12A domain-containing protein [Collybia nuda]